MGSAGEKGAECCVGLILLLCDVIVRQRRKTLTIKRTKIITGISLTLIIITTMGFLGLFAAKQNSDEKYVTEEAYKKNKENQLNMTPKILKQLRELGVSETKELKLEYFFYTNSTEKARKLADKIQKENYKVEYRKSAGDKKLYLITGRTTKMIMSDTVVIEWTKKMCDLGYQFDCQYDGWGTEPDQE